MSDSKVEEGLFYTKEHEWVKPEGDTALVGISDHAQHLLTDVVFVELPAVGKVVEQFKPACVVESVKSVSDVFAPLSGTVAEVNKELEGAPQLVNQDAYGKGWIFKLKPFDASGKTNLMDAAGYRKFLSEQTH